MNLPLPVIAIGLAVVGYLLTIWLSSKRRAPLATMRPRFGQTALDADELGNEALDMEMIRRVQAENERIGIENGYHWSKPRLRGGKK